MSLYARHGGTKQTPQSEPVPHRTDQVENSAGGYVFALDKWARLDRFLVLGTEGGTYYATEKALTLDACNAVAECLAEDGPRTVNRIIEISTTGRNIKQGPVLFALAMACKLGDAQTRTWAYSGVQAVCRTGTMLFEWLGDLKALGGVTSGAQRALSRWYNEREPGQLAYQLVKYQSRGKWSHRDALRLGHIKPSDPRRAAIMGWAAGKVKSLRATEDGSAVMLDGNPLESIEGERVLTESAIFAASCVNEPIIMAFEEAKTADEKRTVELIQYAGLTHEMVATEHLKSPKVWEALLVSMPATALVRSLGRMTACGLLVPNSEAAKSVAAKLDNSEWLRRSRLHPMAVLMANRVYAKGAGVKGSLTWKPVARIVSALDRAFMGTMQNVEPSGKRFYLALDVSGSMSSAMAGPITAAEGAAAMALVTLRTEPNSFIAGFAETLRELPITEQTSLEDALAKTRYINFGSTDCAAPMIDAIKRKIDVDCFVVLTDNETWVGTIHPFQALKRYREERGINAREAVVGMTSTGFTIADPRDGGMLDLVGMDPSTPRAVSLFAKGEA